MREKIEEMKILKERDEKRMRELEEKIKELTEKYEEIN